MMMTIASRFALWGTGRVSSGMLRRLVQESGRKRGICSTSSFLPLMQMSRCYSVQALKELYLHNWHLKKGAKFGMFAGYLMPVQYTDMSIIDSHIHTRNHCSIFDVSHMQQMRVNGRDAVRFVEGLVVSDIAGLKKNHAALTLATNDTGGIIDDMIITKIADDQLHIVSNAGPAMKVLSHFQKNLKEFNSKGGNTELEVISKEVLLAFQGPQVVEALDMIVDGDMEEIAFMESFDTYICMEFETRVTRCGYTGEDGYELTVNAQAAEFLLDYILANRGDFIKLAGLGARDTLRLEAGMCLYGQDIDESTTPVEAGLSWTIGKRRREEGGFPGANVILDQLQNKPKRKRIGIISEGPCPRTGAEIKNADGDVIGIVTSGCFSPCLKKNISMGYVNSAFSKIGTPLQFNIHKKVVQGSVAKMPFVPTKYVT